MTDVSNAKTGSVVFGRLPPTNRITEFVTLAFGPAYLGVLGGALGVGFVGVALGFCLAWYSVYIRRYCGKWAYDAIETFKSYFDKTRFEERQFKGPHPSLPHITDILMMSADVLVLCIISTAFLSYLYFIDVEKLHAFFNTMQPYTDGLFSYYGGLNHEISTLESSPYSGRVVLIKLAVLFIFTSCAYGCVVMSIRMLHGWRQYWSILNHIRHAIILRKESIVLWTLVLSIPLIAGCAHALFYGGFEFFLIMNKPYDDEWYTLFPLIKFVLISYVLVFAVFSQISILCQYLFVLVHRFIAYKSRQQFT